MSIFAESDLSLLQSLVSNDNGCRLSSQCAVAVANQSHFVSVPSEPRSIDFTIVMTVLLGFGCHQPARTFHHTHWLYFFSLSEFCAWFCFDFGCVLCCGPPLYLFFPIAWLAF